MYLAKHNAPRHCPTMHLGIGLPGHKKMQKVCVGPRHRLGLVQAIEINRSGQRRPECSGSRVAGMGLDVRWKRANCKSWPTKRVSIPWWYGLDATDGQHTLFGLGCMEA